MECNSGNLIPKINKECKHMGSMVLSNAQEFRLALWEAKKLFYNFNQDKRDSVFEYLKEKRKHGVQ